MNKERLHSRHHGTHVIGSAILNKFWNQSRMPRMFIFKCNVFFDLFSMSILIMHTLFKFWLHRSVTKNEFENRDRPWWSTYVGWYSLWVYPLKRSVEIRGDTLQLLFKSNYFLIYRYDTSVHCNQRRPRSATGVGNSCVTVWQWLIATKAGGAPRPATDCNSHIKRKSITF
jgi:hypothetical protein